MGKNTALYDLKIAVRIIGEGRIDDGLCMLDSIAHRVPVYCLSEAEAKRVLKDLAGDEIREALRDGDMTASFGKFSKKLSPDYMEAQRNMSQVAANIYKLIKAQCSTDEENAKPKPFWVVWGLGKAKKVRYVTMETIMDCGPNVRHESEEIAVKEAERLAEKHPDKEFHVLRSVSTSTAVKSETVFHGEVK